METPLDKLSSATYETVYEPSQDSFLLIDALELEIEEIKKSHPLMCLEIGSGSGVVITALAMALRSQCCHFVAVDINPTACSATKQMSCDNRVEIDVIRMDLASALCERPIFDLILFNPPYVVTDPTEVASQQMIYRSWAGGERGRMIIERLFEIVPKMLSNKGAFYLLLLKENDPDDIVERFEKVGLVGNAVLERKIPGEHLFVLKFEKKNKC